MRAPDQLCLPVGPPSPLPAPPGRSGADRALLWLAVVTAALVVVTLAAGLTLDAWLTRWAAGAAEPTWATWAGAVFGVLQLALALAVIVRARRNAVGWLLLATIVLDIGGEFVGLVALVGLHAPGVSLPGPGGWAALAESMDRAEFGTASAVLLLFPTGRPPSPRWRPLVRAIAVVYPLWFVAHLLGPADPQEPPFRGLPNPLALRWVGNPVLQHTFLPVAGLLGAAVLVSLVVRYRAGAGDERQQLRWLGLLAAGLPIGIVALGVAALFGDAAMNTVGDVIWIFPEIGLPLAVAIAVTRYRLYDLDLVVNRTIGYALLCAVLAATYGVVVLLATRLVVDGGWTSPIVVAAATLAAAAVAAPSRRVIQNGMDRLFGRRAWDAQRLLATFTAHWSDSPQPPSAVRDVLASALRDPGVEVGFWLRGRGSYVDADNRVLAPPGHGSARSALHIVVGGEPVALVLHDSALDRDRRLLAVVPRAAALVLENARLRVEVLAQLAQVEASRARIVEAADAERRRVERDLHDGAQQRLVGLAMRIRLAARTSPEPDVLAGIVEELQTATRELRELARGIHPGALAEGLLAAVESLAGRSPVPVELDIAVPRLAQRVELTAYYVVAECLTNAVRHASARRIEVHGRIVGSTLALRVDDDGRGGADLARGTGLAGLADRIAVLGGRLEIDSPAGAGTTVRAGLPCDC